MRLRSIRMPESFFSENRQSITAAAPNAFRRIEFICLIVKHQFAAAAIKNQNANPILRFVSIANSLPVLNLWMRMNDCHSSSLCQAVCSFLLPLHIHQFTLIGNTREWKWNFIWMCDVVHKSQMNISIWTLALCVYGPDRGMLKSNRACDAS